MIQNCGVLKEKSAKNKLVVGEKNGKWFRNCCRRHNRAKENGKKLKEMPGKRSRWEKIAIQSCYFCFP